MALLSRSSGYAADRSGLLAVPYASNFVRLSGIEWIGVGILLLILYAAIPFLWNRIEPFAPGEDYRIPYELSEDYRHFSRWCEASSLPGRIAVLGDSVIWGEYVTPGQTLSHYLTEKDGSVFHDNLGVNGIHPAALAGLLEYYGSAISRRSVLLHCNPLWMSSPRRDLQTEKETNLNHPKLLPQFVSRVPSYKAPFSERASIAAERSIPFLRWVNHIRIAYFDNRDFSSWSVDHPYTPPWRQIDTKKLEPGSALRHDPISWTQAGISEQDFPWVDLPSSIQWKYYQRAIAVLQQRGNRVFVLVGPFNEHLLKEKSRATYQILKNQLKTWFSENQISYYIPEPLPSDLYADASHPLSEGYRQLVDRVLEQENFQAWKQGGDIAYE